MFILRMKCLKFKTCHYLKFSKLAPFVILAVTDFFPDRSRPILFSTELFPFQNVNRYLPQTWVCDEKILAMGGNLSTK